MDIALTSPWFDHTPLARRLRQVKNRMLVDGGPRATGGKTIVDAKKAESKKCC